MELTRQQKIFTMVGSLLGLFLAALDQTIVATAGPAMQRDLHIAPSLYAWITTSYVVASTVFVPIWGKLSDTFGRKRILVIGIGVFLAGSVLCGISQSTLQLLLSRALQGIGSASLFTSAFAVVADLYPPAERGKYQGLFGAAFGISSVVGPFIGGFITDTVGWHWVFFVNLPIGAIALAFIFLRMPPLRREAQRLRLDLAGAGALLLFAVPLLLALSLGRRQVIPGEIGFTWDSPQIISMFVAALVGLLLFVVIERRAADPLLDLTLFKNRAFAIGSLASFVVGMTFMASIVFLPLFMVNVVGLSATSSGLTITPLTLGIVGGNVLTGGLVSRFGRYKVFILASLVILIASFALLTFTLTPDATQGSVTLKMVLLGIGLGPSIPLFTLAIQNAVAPPQIGVATSSATFFRSMGATIGLAVLGTVFGSVFASEAREHLQPIAEELPVQARGAFAGPGMFSQPAAEEGAEPSRLIDEKRLSERLTPLVGAAKAGSLGHRIADELKHALTEGMRHLFHATMFIALLGLLITLFLPDLKLRKTPGPPVVAVE